jgi:PBP superfamily domain
MKFTGVTSLFLASTAALMLPAVPAVAQVKIHGATSVAAAIMQTHEAEIKAAAGTNIAILPSSTFNGLTDLAEGKADIAMLGEPLETAAAVLNGRKAGSVDVSVLEGKHIGNAYIYIIINPSNTAGTLSKDQLAGLFSGKVKNWSEVGGPDAPVLVVGDPTSLPHKMISEALSVAHPEDMRKIPNSNLNPLIVAQAPGAISYISSVHNPADLAKVKIVDTSLKLPVKLYLAYRKDAPAAVSKIVAAAAAIGVKQ